MSDLVALSTIAPFDVWGEAVRARKVEGENLTMAIVELAPGAIVPSHTHVHEQLGICIEGSVTFTIGDETRELGPGGTWRILSMRPHSVVTGPKGAVVIDVFAPIRSDWDFQVIDLRPTVWPRSGR